MNEWTHFFIKIYLSHFIWKGWCWLCVRGELETGTDCYILTHSSTSFAFCLGCSTVGHREPQALSLQADSHAGILSPNWLQLQPELELTQAVCGTWLYNCLMPTCFLWAYASAPNSTTSTGQGDIPISSTGCTYFAVLPLIYTGASLDWWLGWGSVCYRTLSKRMNQEWNLQCIWTTLHCQQRGILLKIIPTFEALLLLGVLAAMHMHVGVSIFIWVFMYLTTPPHGQDGTRVQFLSGV